MACKMYQASEGEARWLHSLLGFGDNLKPALLLFNLAHLKATVAGLASYVVVLALNSCMHFSDAGKIRKKSQYSG